MANAICLLHENCRLCLEEPGTYNIFTNDKLAQDVLLCTEVQYLSPADHLPQKICSTCKYKIDVAKDLRRYSTENDLYMKSLLKNNSTIHKIACPKVPLVRPSKEDVNVLVKSEGISDIIDKRNEKEQIDENKNSENDSSPKRPVTRETRAEKSSISVRSLAEINSTVLQSTSSEESSPEKKSERSVSTEFNKSEGDDVHKCNICKKVYQTARKLYMHQRTHSKTLCCPLDACGKYFATKGDLQKHTRSHTGEKPYQCDLCDKSFTQKVTLRSHKQTVHLEY